LKKINNEIEKEYSHIFSGVSDVTHKTTNKNVINKTSEVFKGKKEGLESKKIHIKSLFGKKFLNIIQNILEEKNPESQLINNIDDKQIIYTFNLDEDNFEIPTLTLKKLENKKIKFKLNENAFEKFQDCMMSLRGENKTRNINKKEKQEKCIIKENLIEEEEDIFKEVDSEENITEKKEDKKFQLFDDNEDDVNFSKYKNSNLISLLEPFQKNKKQK
jgi:hypothetical protein